MASIGEVKVPVKFEFEKPGVEVKTVRHLYLDDFGPAKNVLDVTQLPGGEFHPKIPGWAFLDTTSVAIYTRLHNGDDLMKLLTVTNAVREAGIKNVSIFIPYIPGGRQDRVHQLEAFTLRMYADLINSQGYDNVFTIDPHSDVTTALVRNCKPYPMTTIMKEVLQGYDTILVPDAGAAKKVHDYYLKGIDWEGNVIQCLKKRDIKTGILYGFKVLIEDTWKGRLGNTIILDDICDGGGTFLGLAAEVLGRYQHFGLDKLGLYVTHGIFSKGFSKLFESFDEIWTTTSWNSKDQYKEKFAIAGVYKNGKSKGTMFSKDLQRFNVVGI